MVQLLVIWKTYWAEKHVFGPNLLTQPTYFNAYGHGRLQSLKDCGLIQRLTFWLPTALKSIDVE